MNDVKFVDFAKEFESNFVAYSAEVIQNRALPQKDGLKPVQRRILWAMFNMGCSYSSSNKKCGRIVGEVLGKYHCHGDSSVYEALVRMAQPFSMSLPLIKGQGNFGSLDDPSSFAASRYTEAKLSEFSEKIYFADIEDDTVDFIDNYSGEFKEPTVLPTRLPMVLLTAASGIAVGIATTIPPFNLNEICEGILAILSDNKITSEKMSKIIMAPDFPLGGIIKDIPETFEISNKGIGFVLFRSSMKIEALGKSRNIIISDIPYACSKSALIEELAAKVRDDKIEGINEIRDESSKGEIRIVVETKPSIDTRMIIEAICANTSFECKINANMITISEQKPKTSGVLEILKTFIDFRREVIKRRTTSRKKKATDKLELIEALHVAVSNAEESLKIIHIADEPINKLMKRFKFNETQAKYIFNVPVRKFSKQDIKELEKEHKELQEKIKELESILTKKGRIDEIIAVETKEISDKFSYPRKTHIVQDFSQAIVRDTVKKQDVVVQVMSDNSIKATPLIDYMTKKKRDQELKTSRIPDGVYQKLTITADSQSCVYAFTDQGNRYKLDLNEIPVLEKTRPKNLIEYVKQANEKENVVALTKQQLQAGESLVLLSEQGLIKRLNYETYNSTRDASSFYPVDKGGKLIAVLVAKEQDEIIIVTKGGQALRTALSNINEKDGRAAMGVKGMKLADKDIPISMSLVRSGMALATVSTDGYVKKTPLDQFMVKGRGGSGVSATKDGFEVIFGTVTDASEDNGLYLFSSTNRNFRIKFNAIKEGGRAIQGEKLPLEANEKIVYGNCE